MKWLEFKEDKGEAGGEGNGGEYWEDWEVSGELWVVFLPHVNPNLMALLGVLRKPQVEN